MTINEFQRITTASMPDSMNDIELWDASIDRLKENAEEASTLFERTMGAETTEKFAMWRREAGKILAFMLVDLTQLARALGCSLEDLAMQNVLDLIRQKKEDAQAVGGMRCGGKVLELARERVAEIERGADSE